MPPRPPKPPIYYRFFNREGEEDVEYVGLAITHEVTTIDDDHYLLLKFATRDDEEDKYLNIKAERCTRHPGPMNRGPKNGDITKPK